MYEQLIRMLKRNQYKKAQMYLEKEIAIDPVSVYLLTQMAYVLWRQGKENMAIDYVSKAETIDYDDPLLLYTAGKILKSMDRFDESITRWNKILSFDIHFLEDKCQGRNRALAMQNDARFYKAHCLYCKHHDEEAESLLNDHISHRRRGLESDFTIKEVRTFSRILKYSPKNTQSDNMDCELGHPTTEQGFRIQNHIHKLERSQEWKSLKNYIKRKCKEFPGDYWLRTIMAEYLYMEKDKTCLKYAKEAYSMAPDDMLVVYNYACALYINEYYEKATDCLNAIIGKGLDYIAYSEHGEGMRWAKALLSDTKKLLKQISEVVSSTGKAKKMNAF